MNAVVLAAAPGVINISSRSRYEAGKICSNFAQTPFRFTLDASACALLRLERVAPSGLLLPAGSVEGLVQGLKIADAAEQIRVFALSGAEAKSAGRSAPQSVGERMVYVRGVPFGYKSPEHRALIEWAIRQKFGQNETARQALLWTGEATLTHNLGKFDPKPGKTSLPKEVFIRILTEMRSVLFGRTLGKTFTQVLEEINTDANAEAQYYAEAV